MSLSALYILDANGTVLITRDYRGDVDREIIAHFIPLLHEREALGTATPILPHERTSFAYLKLDGLYLVSVIRKNANAALVFSFMHKFVEIASEYFDRLEEESVRDNFVVLHELLDEVMDFGYPQTTDPKVLQTYIFQQSRKLQTRVPAAVTSAVSWRPEGVRYRRNELFIDVVEAVDLAVRAGLKSQVSGCVKMRARLSGMPQLRLGLSDHVLQMRSFEDVKFHHCVQMSRLLDNSVYFVPPDGDFELLSYRLSTDMRPLIAVESRLIKSTSSRLEYKIKACAQFRASSTASNVEVTVPVCPDVDSPFLKTSLGVANYVPEKSAVVWKMKYLPGGSEVYLNLQFKLSSIKGEGRGEKTPIMVKFTIPYFTISGLQIKFVKVIEKSNYKALTWVRYTTKNGEYLISFN